MIDFPATPTTGQTFDPGTGIVYSYDGVAWNAVTTSTKTANARNRLTNGSVQVSQENGSSVVSTNGAYPADMWGLSFVGVSGQAVRSTVNVSPDGNGLAYFQSFGAVKSSLAASDFCQNINTIEAQNTADFLWGTAAAKQVVLRFNAYAEVAGLYSVAILNGASNRSYVKGINLTTGWQTFVLVIPGDTLGTWPTDNTAGLSVRFCSAVGSSFVGVDGVWQAGALLGVPGQLNGAAQANKNLVFTDVALYLDPDKTGLAPKYELPDYGSELARCQRYYDIMNFFISGYHAAGNQVAVMLCHKVSMRATPTIVYGVSSYGNCSGISTYGANDQAILGVAVTVTGTGGCSCQGTAYSSARM